MRKELACGEILHIGAALKLTKKTNIKTSLKINHAARASKVDTVETHVTKAGAICKKELLYKAACGAVPSGSAPRTGTFLSPGVNQYYYGALLQAWTKLNLPPLAKIVAVWQFQQ